VVTSVDPLLGKTYNSLGFSRSQDDKEQQKDGNHRGMIKTFSSFFMYLFISPCP
jgi:hypothetical protein